MGNEPLHSNGSFYIAFLIFHFHFTNHKSNGVMHLFVQYLLGHIWFQSSLFMDIYLKQNGIGRGTSQIILGLQPYVF